MWDLLEYRVFMQLNDVMYEITELGFEIYTSKDL